MLFKLLHFTKIIVWEGDSHEWVDKKTGYFCSMRRSVREDSNFINWCGYVEVPPTHPFHSFSYDDCLKGCVGSDAMDCKHMRPSDLLDVHGGLTFGNGEKFGFDCAHAGDICQNFEFDDCHPSGRANMRMREMYVSYPLPGPVFGYGNAVYRDKEWVIAETERLAAQLYKRRRYKSKR